MKKLYFFLLLASSLNQAQTFQWINKPDINLGLNPDLVGYCCATDPIGNIYVTGFKDNATPYNDIFGDLIFNKYNAAGELQFANTFTGKGNVFDIAADGFGNITLAVGYLGTLTIGTQTFTTANTGVEPLIVKLNPQGELLWHYSPMIGALPAAYFKAITADSAGNTYAGFDNFNASYILKLSPEGLPLLTITQANVKLLSSLAVDNAGNIYAAGSCAEPNAIFAGIAVPTTFDYNTWLVKYTANGVHQWTRYINDITCSHPEVKAVSPDAVYFSSYLFGAYAFGSFTASGPFSGSFNDFFLAKLDASGVFKWVREVPGAGTVYTGKRNYLETDAAGNAYFVGSTRNTVDWGNGITSAGHASSSDALLLKYDSEGALQYAKTAGGSSEDRIDGVTVNMDGEVFVSGMARGNAAFDSLEITSAGIIPYPFIAKISNGTLATASEIKPAIRLYPNPAADSFHTGVKCSGAIYNSLGQKILPLESDGIQSIVVSSLPKGVYVIKCVGFSDCKLVKK